MSATSSQLQPAVLRLELMCDLAEARRASQAIHSFLAQAGCPESDILDCELALVEACNNAILYAQGPARAQQVIVEALCDPQVIEFRVADHTAGFEWPKEVSLPDPESESGRGLYLIRSLMDEAAYQRGAEANVLVLRKKRLEKALTFDRTAPAPEA
ncbi:MAG TPA: ATP-binding protein [Bacillota bacterium]|nr:ATP-binding protein [Bacillota bacterium]